MGLDMYMDVVRKHDNQKYNIVVERDTEGWNDKFFLQAPNGERHRVEAQFNKNKNVLDDDDAARDWDWIFTEPVYEHYNKSAYDVVGEGNIVDNFYNNDFYWRKFNALHYWMVNNYDGDEDDCEAHRLSNEKFLEVYERLKKIVEIFPPEEEWETIEEKFGNSNETYTYKEPIITHELREKLDALLPPHSGFFFGSTLYDDWYFGHVKRTLKMFEPIVEEVKKGNVVEFIYRASW